MVIDLAPGDLLRAAWGLTDVVLTRQPGGMNSRTWRVDFPGGTWALKHVQRRLAPSFEAGLDTAQRLAGAGLLTGTPVRSVDGRCSVEATVLGVDGTAALLTWVPGEPLTGADETEQRLIGATLGRAHRVLLDAPPHGADVREFIDLRSEHLDREPWLRPALVAACDAVAGPDLTTGRLHGDPAPEAFLRRPGSSTCGLIDWSSAVDGPLLYDVASAVMYLGGPAPAAAFLAAYAAVGVLSAEELSRHLDVWRTFRWAVQAAYFARRLAEADLTGLSSDAGNAKGLADARRGLGV